MCQRSLTFIHGHRLTLHNLPFQATTYQPPQHRPQAHPGLSVPDTVAISRRARPLA